MSYRSIKRVLGETRLELKMLFLFGLCISVVIALAFLFVERAVVQLVTQNTRDKARTLIASQLLKRHLEKWFSDDENDAQREDTARFLELISKDFSPVNYEYAVIVEDQGRVRYQVPHVETPDEEELEFIAELRAEVDAALASRQVELSQGDGALPSVEELPTLLVLINASHRCFVIVPAPRKTRTSTTCRSSLPNAVSTVIAMGPPRVRVSRPSVVASMTTNCTCCV
ncbi:MAG: hypothetical protein R3B96_19765 [Pirellulaceae bacterium]